jgi:hypothetical protein
MAHVVVPNIPPPDTFNCYYFQAVWKLTRAMKKAGWIVKASSDGTNKDTSGLPQNDKWGIGVITNNGTIAGTNFTTMNNDLLTLTGLSGLSTAAFGGSEGRFLTITGANTSGNNGTFQIVQVLSATSCIIRNAAGSTVETSGSISWTERDPTLDIVNTNANNTVTIGNASWICMQGPSTLKVPLSTFPVGTFLRGEKVTQANSNAEGELLGVTYDPTSGVGYAVILPRHTGSGAGARGWSNTDVITGASTSATLTPTGTIEEFVCEMVFARDSTDANRRGHWFYQRLSVLTENAQRFSYLAANAAGCTATVGPCLGGTGNTQAAVPSTGVFGMYGALGGGTSSWWDPSNQFQSSATGNSHVMCANAIERPGQSGDGSWIIAMNMVSFSSVDYAGFYFQRLDDTEEGDVDPYACWTGGHTNTSFSTQNASYTKTGLQGDTTDHYSFAFGSINIRTDRYNMKATRRRGLGSNENIAVCLPAILRPGTAYNGGPVTLMNSWGYSLTDPEKTQSTYVQALLREPIWVTSPNQGSRLRKGTYRWIYLACGAQCNDTWDGKRWVQFRNHWQSTNANSDGMPYLLGPWDQSTLPLSSNQFY